jgi:hypothetical protein
MLTARGRPRVGSLWFDDGIPVERIARLLDDVRESEAIQSAEIVSVGRTIVERFRTVTGPRRGCVN